MSEQLDLAALLADPTGVPHDRIPDVLGELERVRGVLWARLVTAAPPPRPSDDALVDVDEAARLLDMSTKWLYRHARRLPFTRRVGRSLKFSREGIHRYLARRP
jgi:excisionase family DNA binding protein